MILKGSEVNVSGFWERMKNFQGTFMTCLVFILVQLQISTSTSKKTLSVCEGGSSLIFEGECVECIHPNLHIPCLQAFSKNHFTDKNFSIAVASCTEKIYLCSSDIEEQRLSRGRKFLDQRILQVVTIERPPFVNVKGDNYSGVVIELLLALQLKYNFTPNIFLPYDGNWGAKNDDGTWNGMIGQVLRKEADLAAASLSVTEDRARAVAFSMAFHQEPCAILIPAPTAGSKLETLVKPFSPKVWLAVLVTITLLVPTLFVLHILRLRAQGLIEVCKNLDSVRLLLDLFQFTIGSLVQESLISPVQRTTKFLVVIWWFATLIISNVYTGYMVSLLSAPKLYDLIDSVEGLVSQHTLRWTYRRSTALEDLFQSNVSTVYNSIAAGASDADLVSKDTEGVEKVLGGKFAFIKEKSFLDVAIGEDFLKMHKCRITIASQTFFNTGFAVAVQKGSAFLHLLDNEILKAMTTGLMEKWKMLHWPHNLFCVNAASYIIATQPTTRAFTLNDSIGAYFILLCGICISCISFLFEMGIYQSLIFYRKPRHF